MSVDLVVGTPTPTSMNINDNGTLGTPVSLPLATSSDAGLMSANDKEKIILQGGNAFGVAMDIGPNDSKALNFRVNGTTVGLFATSGNFYTNHIGYLQSGTGSPNSALITFASSGVTVSRNVADASVPLTVNSVQGTGVIQNWSQAGVPVAAMNLSGILYGQGLANGTTINNALIESKSTGTVISRNIADTNAALIVNQKNASSTGNTMTLQKAGSDQLSMSSSGVLKVNNLSGTGTRIVTADSTGALGATMLQELSSGSYTPTITGNDTYTPHGFRYTRVGEVIHVSGAIEVTSASIGGLNFNISLPPSISTTFTNEWDLTGVASGEYVLQNNYVLADYSTNEAIVKVTSTQLSCIVLVQFDFIKQ